MAKKGNDSSSEGDDSELDEYRDDKYAAVSPNIKKGLQEADKQKGQKPLGVTDP